MSYIIQKNTLNWIKNFSLFRIVILFINQTLAFIYSLRQLLIDAFHIILINPNTFSKFSLSSLYMCSNIFLYHSHSHLLIKFWNASHPLIDLNWLFFDRSSLWSINTHCNLFSHLNLIRSVLLFLIQSNHKHNSYCFLTGYLQFSRESEHEPKQQQPFESLTRSLLDTFRRFHLFYFVTRFPPDRVSPAPIATAGRNTFTAIEEDHRAFSVWILISYGDI